MTARLDLAHRAVKFLKEVDPDRARSSGLDADLLDCFRAHGDGQERLTAIITSKILALLDSVRPADPADQEKQRALLAEFRDPGSLLSDALDKIPPKHTN